MKIMKMNKWNEKIIIIMKIMKIIIKWIIK